MRFQNELRCSAPWPAHGTPTQSVIPLFQRPSLWSDSALGPSGKTDPRPAVKSDLNRAGQIAGSNAGGTARFPGHPETGDGEVVPLKARTSPFSMELRKHSRPV